MKSNKKIKQIAVIILIILSLLGINLSVNKIVKNFSDARNINAKSGDYTPVQYGEERVEGTNFVTFDAYFLKTARNIEENIYHTLKIEIKVIMPHLKIYGLS